MVKKKSKCIECPKKDREISILKSNLDGIQTLYVTEIKNDVTVPGDKYYLLLKTRCSVKSIFICIMF